MDDRALEQAGRRITWIGAGANALLVVCKIALGVVGQSQALIADGIHSISDFVTDAIVLVGLKVGRKAPDEDHHFGHGRFETLASALVGVSLLVVAVYLGWEGVTAVISGSGQHPSWWAVVGAAFSIVVKEVLYQATARVGRRMGSTVVEANAWHHRSDALSSVAVLVGVGAAQFNPDWYVLDAYATCVVSVFIAKVGVDVLREALHEMTDTAPAPEVIASLTGAARAVEGVVGCHDLKVRIVGGRYQLQVHVEVDAGITVRDGHAIAKTVERMLLERDRVRSVIVHVDPVERDD